MKISLVLATGVGLIATTPSLGSQSHLPVWAERLGWTLVHSVWELTLVAVLAALIDRLLNRTTANTRYLAAVTSFCVMIVVAGATFTLIDVREREVNIPIPSGTITHPAFERLMLEAQINATTIPLSESADSTPVTPSQATVPPIVRDEQAPASILDATPEATIQSPAVVPWPTRLSAIIQPRLWVIILSWIVGVALCLCRPIWGLWTQWQLGRTGLTPVPELVEQMLFDVTRRLGLGRAIRIAESIYVRGPLVVGYMRPIILLPVNVLTALTPPQLRAVLAHEVAHIRRHDMLVNGLQVLAETLLFYHPAVWWLSRRIRQERENCCDDLAVSLSGDRVTYAQMLLSLEEMRQAVPVPMLAATGGTLVQRVRRLLPKQQIARRGPRSWLPGTALLFAMICGAFLWSMFQSAESVAQQKSETASIEPLTGVVLGVDGAPVEGATVTAAALYVSPARRITTKTDERGHFRIEIPPARDELYGSGQTLPYVLAIRWKMFGVDIEEAVNAHGQSVSIEGQKLPEQTIRLRPAGRLHGKLLQQEDDRPVAGAKLFLSTGEILTADENGQFEVNGLPLDAHSLVVVAPGRVREYIAFNTSQHPDTELELRLPRGAVIKGRVRDQQGKAIRGAFVQLRKRCRNGLTMNGWAAACRDDGTYEFDGISPSDSTSNFEVIAPGFDEGQFKVAAMSPGDAIERNVTLKSLGTADAEKLQAAKFRTVTGTVQDAAGNPIVGATIRNGNSCERPVEASTDIAGRFTLVVSQPLDSLVAFAPGYAPQLVVMDDVPRVPFVLQKGGEARGVVVDSAGQPIGGVEVEMNLDGQRFRSTSVEERNTKTNARGEFQIADVPLQNANFSFHKDGYTPQRVVRLTLDGSVNQVQMVVRGAVKGRVVDSSGRPVRNFKIRATYPRPFQREGEGLLVDLNEEQAVHFTRDNGTFVLTGFGANRWLRLVVSATGIGWAAIDRLQSTPIDDLSKTEQLTIVLKPSEPLTVRVEEGASGKPVPGAVLRLFDQDVTILDGIGRFGWDEVQSFDAQAETNSDGEARFAAQEFDSGVLTVNAAGLARRRIPWQPGERTMKVTLDAEARLNGEVRSNGQPLRQGKAQLNSKLDSFSVDLAQTAGRLNFDRLPAGQYDLDIRGSEQILMSRRLHLASGATASVTLNIAAAEAPVADQDRGISETRPVGSRFNYRVVDSSGQPVVGATAAITHINAWKGPAKTFNVDSRRFPPDATLFPPFTSDSEGIVCVEIPDDDAVAGAGYPEQREARIRETLKERDLTFHLRIEHPDHPRWEDRVFSTHSHPVVLADSVNVVLRAHRGNDPAPAHRLCAIRRFWNESTFSDADGVVTLRHVDLSSENAARFLRVLQIPEGGLAWFSDLIDLREHQKGNQVSLDVELKPGARLEGRLSENVPRPVEHGRIVAWIVAGESQIAWQWVDVADITPDGTFVFPSLPQNENVQLVAICDGWVSRSTSIEQMKAFARQHHFPDSKIEERMKRRVDTVFPQLVRLDQSMPQIDIPMERTCVAEVRVLDENDKPIENVGVSFSPNQLHFDGGSASVGWGFDEMSLIREQLESGKAPTVQELFAKWARNRHYAKTNSEGVATVVELPIGSPEKDGEAIEHWFGLFHDDYDLTDPPLKNREDFRNSTTIRLVKGQKANITVRMKRK